MFQHHPQQYALIKSLLESLGQLISLFFFLIIQLLLIYHQYTIFPHLICLAIVAYLIFLILSQSTIQSIVGLFINYKKYNTLHSYLQQPSSFQNEYDALKIILQEKTPIKDDKMMRSSINQSKIRIRVQKQRIKINDNIKTNEMSSEQIEYQQYPKESYLKRSQNYKIFMNTFIKKYNIDIHQYNISKNKIKQSFQKKLEELLISNKNNIKEMIYLLQKKYEVEVIQDENTSKKSFNKLMTVTVDEAYNSLEIFLTKKFLRWNERKYEQMRGDISFEEKIQKLMKERRIIDHYLSPYNQICHNQRVQIVNKLQNNKKNPQLIGRQYFIILFQFYNEYIRQSNVNQQEKYYILRQKYSQESCLQAIQEKISDHHIHFDLSSVRKESKTYIFCQPGSNNIWSCLNLAFYHFKLKI